MKPIDLHLINAEAKFKEAINHAFDLGWEASEERIIKLLEGLGYIDEEGHEMISEFKADLITLIKEEK